MIPPVPFKRTLCSAGSFHGIERLTKEISPQYHHDRHLSIYFPVAFFPLILISAEARGQLHAGLFLLRCDVTDAS